MTGRPTPRTISTKQARIAGLAKQMPGTALRSLSHHMDLEWMREAYRRTRKDGAPGVDGSSAADFAADLTVNLQDLLDRAKSGTYRAPPVRRVEIPKGGGKTRPIGIPTFGDKVLQRAVVMQLEPVYEEDFYDFSHGFRPRRSAQGAYTALRDALWDMRGGWVLDADVSNFFDTLDRRQLQILLRQRVVDGVVVRLVGKWLNAGVMSEGRLERPTAGTPQGGVISPLLANIYLHEVLDRWWEEEVLPRIKGRAILIRYADDLRDGFLRRGRRETGPCGPAEASWPIRPHPPPGEDPAGALQAAPIRWRGSPSGDLRLRGIYAVLGSLPPWQVGAEGEDGREPTHPRSTDPEGMDGAQSPLAGRCAGRGSRAEAPRSLQLLRGAWELSLHRSLPTRSDQTVETGPRAPQPAVSDLGEVRSDPPPPSPPAGPVALMAPPAASTGECVSRRAGCGNSARPDLWGAGEGNLPGLPDPHRFYNPKRLHSTLGFRTPLAVETQHQASKTEAA